LEWVVDGHGWYMLGFSGHIVLVVTGVDVIASFGTAEFAGVYHSRKNVEASMRTPFQAASP